MRVALKPHGAVPFPDVPVTGTEMSGKVAHWTTCLAGSQMVMGLGLCFAVAMDEHVSVSCCFTSGDHYYLARMLTRGWINVMTRLAQHEL